jgi:hypothetical protein
LSFGHSANVAIGRHKINDTTRSEMVQRRAEQISISSQRRASHHIASHHITSHIIAQSIAEQSIISQTIVEHHRTEHCIAERHRRAGLYFHIPCLPRSATEIWTVSMLGMQIQTLQASGSGILNSPSRVIFLLKQAIIDFNRLRCSRVHCCRPFVLLFGIELLDRER